MTSGNETRSPLTCRLLGHRWQPEAAEYYCHYVCTRCGHEGYSDGSVRERIRLRIWLWRQWFEGWTRLWRRWIRCEYCGCWFGNHDYAKDDHIPF
jgi:hypothetical protein